MPLPARSRIDRLFPWLLAIGLPLLAGLLLGGDSSWDLRNYHLYDPHAWWTGRDAIDIAAAQQQSWHNPTLDLPTYLLARGGATARVLTLWLVLPAMLLLWSLLRLHAQLSPTPPTRLAQAVLAILALTGAGIGGTLGLSSNDGLVAAGMLLAMTFALDAIRSGTSRGWWLAGLAAGATAGLKLSAGYGCIAFAVAALAGGQAPSRGVRLACLAAGGLAGALLTYGWWAWHLQATYANPFFPYFNDAFHSASAMAVSHADLRFRPPTPMDALLAPVRLLRTTTLYSELRMRDPRVLLCLLGFGWLWWRTPRAPDRLRAQLGAVCLFAVAGTTLWLAQSGVYRYATPIEALGALVVVLLAQRAARWQSAVLVVALLLVSVDTRRPHWGRDAGPAPLQAMRAPPLGPGRALVLTASDDPLGYLALGLPRDVPLVALGNNFMQPAHCTALQERASRRVAGHDGPLWLLEDPSRPAPARTLLGVHYGLAATDCIAYDNPLGPARLCRLARIRKVDAPCLVSDGTRTGAPR